MPDAAAALAAWRTGPVQDAIQVCVCETRRERAIDRFAPPLTDPPSPPRPPRPPWPPPPPLFQPGWTTWPLWRVEGPPALQSGSPAQSRTAAARVPSPPSQRSAGPASRPAPTKLTATTGRSTSATRAGRATVARRRAGRGRGRATRTPRPATPRLARPRCRAACTTRGSPSQQPLWGAWRRAWRQKAGEPPKTHTQ